LDKSKKKEAISLGTVRAKENLTLKGQYGKVQTQASLRYQDKPYEWTNNVPIVTRTLHLSDSKRRALTYGYAIAERLW
jgi:hypothetical protein